ncbi:MAG: hypothetical protein K2N27_03325 [Ruminococcus sp.]|nr:hypothetical protein [Ruminococcus sp.]
MNIDIENLVALIRESLLNKGYDIYSDESVERLNALGERIEKDPCFSKRFKAQLINELTIAVDSASLESFENGLLVGLGVLKNLLTAENPEIHIVTTNPKNRPERYTPEYPLNPEFTEYMAWADRHLSDIEKGRIISEAEAFIENNREKTYSFF